MGIRGEIKSYKLVDRAFTYFFNVKEDRSKTLFLTMVLSEQNEDKSYKRNQIMIYTEDIEAFVGTFKKVIEAGKKHSKDEEERTYSAQLETERRTYSFNMKENKAKRDFSLNIKETLKFDPEKNNKIIIFERNFPKIESILEEVLFFMKGLRR